MNILRAGISWLLCTPVLAFAWTYTPVISVSELRQAHTFAHLESSGNRSIAISNSQIAVTWEDNHSGKSEVYVAFKDMNAVAFSPALRVSDAVPAYEPALAGLGDGRFVVVWEANDHVWARVVSEKHTGGVSYRNKWRARRPLARVVMGSSGWPGLRKPRDTTKSWQRERRCTMMRYKRRR